MNSEGINLSSFDVFDTLLTRSVGQPTSLFLLLGRRLAAKGMISCTPEIFASVRMEAEHRARLNWRDDEVTLVQIYSEVEAALGLQAEDVHRLCTEEICIESEAIRLVPHSKHLVDMARKGNGHVIFITDTYLPQTFIEQQLRNYWLLIDGDHIYVSSEYGYRKCTGHLFEAVTYREGIKPSQLGHCGDNKFSDVSIPKQIGCRVSHFTKCELNRYERIMEAHSWKTGGLSSVLAGSSRLARLEINENERHLRTIQEVGASVVAPFLISYIVWVLRGAQKRGLRRLYFVSRDGKILLDVAHHISRKLGIDIELRYLYGSRQAWHLPSISEINEEVLDWLLVIPHNQTSITDILERVDLDPGEVENSLRANGLDKPMWSQPLTDEVLQKLRSVLCDDIVQKTILERASMRRGPVLQYLRGEGLLEDKNWALVDVGWRGRCQASLGKLLQLCDAPPPSGFYLGLYDENRSSDAGVMWSYLFNRKLRVGHLDIFPQFQAVVEMFCTAGHGTTIGYETDGVETTPLLSPPNSRAVAWGLDKLHHTVQTVADLIWLDQELVDVDADLRAMCMTLLKEFWLSPSLDEAKTWGEFSVSSDQIGGIAYQFAGAYHWSDIWKMFGKTDPPHKNPWWWEAGAWKLTPLPVRISLTFMRHLSTLLKRTRNKLIHLCHTA